MIPLILTTKLPFIGYQYETCKRCQQENTPKPVCIQIGLGVFFCSAVE